MATETFINYPASGIYSGMTNVMNALAKFVIEKFPLGTIKALHVDDRVSIQNLYKNVLSVYQGETATKMGNIEEITKIPRPHCYVGWTMESGFDTEETGLNVFPLYHYPHAFFFDDEMVGVNPILIDKRRKIFIGSQYLRIKLTAEFLFNCINKEEQITLYGYLKNNLKDMYMYAVPNIAVNYTMPSSLLLQLKTILFGEQTPYTKIHEEFNAYLKEKSKDGIIPVYRNGKKDVFYEMLVDYRQIDFKLTGKMAVDDGEKKDQVYSNYTIRFPAQAEFYIPHNYILKTPELIPATYNGVYQVPDHITLSDETDSNNRVQVLNVIKKKIENPRKRYLGNYDFLTSDEFAIETPNDYYEILRLFKNTFSTFYNLLDTKEKSDSFKVFLYEDTVEVDEKQVSMDWDNFIVSFKDCDPTQVFTVEIYIDVDKYKGYLLQKLKNPEILFMLLRLVVLGELSFDLLLFYAGLGPLLHDKKYLELLWNMMNPNMKMPKIDSIDYFFKFFLTNFLDIKFLRELFRRFGLLFDSNKTILELLQELLEKVGDIRTVFEEVIKELAKKRNIDLSKYTQDKILSFGYDKVDKALRESIKCGFPYIKLYNHIRHFTVTLFNNSAKVIKEF